MKPLICLDFDGVIAMHDIRNRPVPGARAFILRALEEFRLCVFSCRSNRPGGIDYMQNYMIDQLGLAADLVTREIRWPREKPRASVTIDNRAIHFAGTWPDLEVLRNFQPWNYGGNDGGQ